MKQKKERRRTELYDSGCIALIEAIVRRDQAPGRELGAVDIEQLFILMAKED